MVEPTKFPDELDVKLERKKKKELRKDLRFFVLNSRMNVIVL